MKIRLILIVALSVTALAGCSDERAEVGTTFYHLGGIPEDIELHIELRDNWHQYYYILNNEEPSKGPYLTGGGGVLEVAFIILDGSYESTTDGVLELPLKPDWRWWIDFHITENDPIHTCWGCMGSIEYDLDPALGYDESMKLYVVWGGNSISNPVIY